VALHYNGVRWLSVPTGVVRPLFTVHGNDTRVAATGGAFSGVLIELEGNAFVDRTPVGAPQINGVFISPAGPAAAVGSEGTFALRGPDAWELKTPVTTTGPRDFHATWMDTAGGVWAVGGDLTIDQSHGILAYAGSAAIGRNFLSDGPCAPGSAGKPGTVSYSRDILPLFNSAGCLNAGCHAGVLLSSEYDLTTYEGTFGPGLAARNFGMCDVVPGNPDASFLIEKLGPSPRIGLTMPNGLNPLRPDQIALVRTWILEGARKDTLPPPGSFSRGDANGDGGFNIADASFTLNFLFLGGIDPPCLASADSNGDGDVNIADASFTLNFLFLGGGAPPAPYPGCAQNQAGARLSCDTSTCE
jgi:hypothetical protein